MFLNFKKKVEFLYNFRVSVINKSKIIRAAFLKHDFAKTFLTVNKYTAFLAGFIFIILLRLFLGFFFPPGKKK